MEPGLQHLIIQFDDAASLVYADIFNQLRRSLSKTSRAANENIYKMQEARYILLLRNRLGELAAFLLEKNHGHPSFSKIHSSLSVKIDYYLQEFRQRSASL